MEVLEHQRNDMIELKTGLLHHVSFLANTNTQHSILVECILYKTVICFVQWTKFANHSTLN
jgi:hypothetical protein